MVSLLFERNIKENQNRKIYVHQLLDRSTSVHAYLNIDYM